MLNIARGSIGTAMNNRKPLTLRKSPHYVLTAERIEDTGAVLIVERSSSVRRGYTRRTWETTALELSAEDAVKLYEYLKPDEH